MQKRTRISYKSINSPKFGPCITTDVYYSFQFSYYAYIIGTGSAEVKIYNNKNSLIAENTFKDVTKAKRFIRNKLIELDCLLESELKTGILIDKEGKTVIKLNKRRKL